MASQSFNARGGISVGLTGTSVISETGVGTFPVGITVSGITLNGTIISSGLGTFNAGITTSGITLNGPIISSGLGTFNAGITSAGATFTGNINLVNTLNGTSVQVTSNARSWFI